MASEDEIAGIRAERDDWRRRAEVAEAVSAERLARAENAERALRAAEAALGRGGAPRPPDPVEGEIPPAPGEQGRPATLRERWRRYTETIN